MARPRTTSLEPDEMIALGEEMLDWVKKNNPIHLSMWYSIEKMFTEKQWDAMQQMPEFLPYYEKALKIVGYNYITKGSDVEPAIKQRWQRVYFKDLKREEDESLANEIKLKAQEASQATEEQNKKMDAFLSQLKSLQSSSSIDDNNKSTESKS